MSRLRSKQMFLTGSFSGSFVGDGSALRNVTASVAVSMITSGSVTASVDIGGNSVFLIKSGSYSLFEVSSSNESTLYSNLFIIKNFNTGATVFTVSESVVKLATQSAEPTGNTDAGTILFTSNSMFIGLE